MTKKVLYQAFVNWLPFAIIIVIFSGLAYGTVQQVYRQSANDQLFQVIESITNNINQGQPLSQIVPAQGITDLTATILPFAMVYDATSTEIGSSILLDGKNPTVPAGMLAAAKARGQLAETWQPALGVREAVVVKYLSGTQSGYLVVGRSLKQTEILENQTLLMSEIAGIIALVLTFIVLLFFANRAMAPEVKEEVTLDIKLTETKDAPKL
jgi:hypothetical protein